MNTQTVLAVFGILATTLFGFWAIAAAFRFRRNVRITYALDQIIALTDDITQNFQDLRVTFRGEPVSANLVLLKGYLINTGRRDISTEMVEDQISLHVPSDFEWVDCKVGATSPSLHAEARLKSAQEVEFTTGLWKIKEYMKFEALAKVPLVETDPENPPDEKPTHRLSKVISFTHRIADSDRIEQTRIPRPSRMTASQFPFGLTVPRKSKCIAASVIIAIGILSLVAAKFDLVSSKQLGYSVTIDGVERVLEAQVKNDMVILSGDDDFSRELSCLEFDQLPDKKAVVVTKADLVLLVAGMAYGALGFLLLAIYGLSAMKDRRMLALIASKEEA